MSSFFFSAVTYILAKLASVIQNISPHFFDVDGIPQIPSLLGGYDTGLLYALNPCGFLGQCQKRYGPVYRMSLGYWHSATVVSSGNSISSMLATPGEILSNDILHREMFDVISGAKTNFSKLHHVMAQELFPFIDRALSQRSLGQTTETFGLVLHSQIKKFVQAHKGPISITELTQNPLYNATNLVFLGSAFPANTSADFRILNKSVPYRFSKTLLWYWPSYAARMRLLGTLDKYLQRKEVTNYDDRFSSAFIKIIKDNNVQPMEEAQLVLNFLWSIHTNTLNNSLFLLTFLLDDQNGFARVRTEIDSAVRKFGSLERLLEASPDELDDPSLKLLTSAIMETLRLTGFLTGIREAKCDFDLKVEDGFIPIKKGEIVFGNMRAVHMDPTIFPNPEAFVVDRFAQHPYQKKHLQAEGYHFHALGGGRGICKGRWLALYQIKILMIILLHMFDFSPAGEGAVGWRRLRAHTRSIGVMHTEDDFLLQLSPRHVGV